jgi:hypothetical protein
MTILAKHQLYGQTKAAFISPFLHSLLKSKNLNQYFFHFSAFQSRVKHLLFVIRLYEIIRIQRSILEYPDIYRNRTHISATSITQKD